MNASSSPRSNLLFLAGVSIITATHIYMLNAQLPMSVQHSHAYLNLGAVALILFSVR